MNLHAIKHISKSHMAYAYDKNTLHITLQTAKNDVESVKLLVGDPFDWDFIDGEYKWVGTTKGHINMYKRYTTDLFDYFFVEYKTKTLRSKYAFLIQSGSDEYFYGCRDLIKLNSKNINSYNSNLFGYFNYPYINDGDLIDSPKWAKDIIWYQIFPDRFARDNHENDDILREKYDASKSLNEYYFGGTLKGITSKIPYLVDLGITGIYFTPIFKAYSSHKYDTEDYFEIDPAFGTKEDLKILVEECHKNNIKIMLDAVFNHCGWEHPYFQDVVKNQRQSKYWDWFYIDRDDFINFEIDKNNRPVYRHKNIKPNYKTFAFAPVMPKWNADNPETRKYLISIGTYWIKEFDIDGWRLDVSNEVSHDFWRDFKKAVRNVKSDIYILGENWDDSTAWLRGDQYDAVMNYEFAYPVWQYFGKEKGLINITTEEFRYRIDKLLMSYPDNISANMFNMISSHDTSRMNIKCLENLEITKLSYLFMFSFGGSPAIYYGDEVGMGEITDKDNRTPMFWGEKQDTNMLLFFKKMIKLRKENWEFRDINIEWISNKQDLLAYRKGNIIFLINTQGKPINLSNFINFPTIDLYNGFELHKNDNITVDKHGFKILKIKK